jgi:hypothetical protein
VHINPCLFNKWTVCVFILDVLSVAHCVGFRMAIEAETAFPMIGLSHLMWDHRMSTPGGKSLISHCLAIIFALFLAMGGDTVILCSAQFLAASGQPGSVQVVLKTHTIPLSRGGLGPSKANKKTLARSKEAISDPPFNKGNQPMP